MKNLEVVPVNIQGVHEFHEGGYYIHQEETLKTFLRCGSYKDRPSQSDNLHIDIWKDGVNYLWDNGTYKYNTNKETVDYFTGCEGHNTLSLEGKNQMLRGGRFIWTYWIKRAKAKMIETAHKMTFEGEIEAFQYIEKGIKHCRTVEKNKRESQWLITDSVSKANGKQRSLTWHVNPEVFHLVEIHCENLEGKTITPVIEEKWHSSYYGVKEKSMRYFFSGHETLRTTIKIKDQF